MSVESNKKYRGKDILKLFDNEDEDQPYEHDQVCVPDDLKSSSAEVGNQLTDFLHISPIKLQLTNTHIHEKVPVRKKL